MTKTTDLTPLLKRLQPAASSPIPANTAVPPEEDSHDQDHRPHAFAEKAATGTHSSHPAGAHRPGTPGAIGLRLFPGDRPQRRDKPPRPPPHRDEAAPGRLPRDLPPGRLRLVGVHQSGPPSAGRRLLIGVSRQAGARPAGWDPPAWARASWLRPWAMLRSGPDTQCASSTPTTTPKSWLRHGWTTPWNAPSVPS